MDDHLVEGSGDVVPLGAGDGRSHRLHHRHLGVDLGARLGDDHRRGMAAQHGGQVGEIHYSITEPLRTKGMKAQRRMIYILHCMKIVKNLADNTRYRRTTAQLVNVW